MVEGDIKDYKRGYDYWDGEGKIHHLKSTAKVNITIKIQDRFGVDENDFAASDYWPIPYEVHSAIPLIITPNPKRSWGQAGKSAITALGREALACFWILQHERGYKPFVQELAFKSSFTIEFN